MTAADPTECEHGGDPHSCPPCQRANRPDLVAPLAVVPPTIEGRFSARFPGDCPSCRLPVIEGQACVRWSDGRNRHEGCRP